jgi:hypothetical protein
MFYHSQYRSADPIQPVTKTQDVANKVIFKEILDHYLLKSCIFGKSAPRRHPIPVHVGTLFRNMPAGDSGASRQVFVI